MPIEELYILNFKCLDNIRLPLCPISVLAGLNGMGKSSILQSLLLMQQSYLVSADNLIDRLVLNGSLVNVGTAKDALWEGATDDQISLGLVVDGIKYIWNFSYAEGEDELLSLGEEPKSPPTGAGIFSDDFHYLRAERFGPKASFPVSSTMVRHRRQIGRDGEYASSFLATYGTDKLENKMLVHKDATSEQLRHQLEAWLGEISPGTRVYTQTHSGLDLVSMEFAFVSGLGETEHFRATNVGFGISYILPIVLVVLSARPGSLILLENPEAHLHPRGQVKMGELLALASLGGVQLIVETHSDHLLNGIRLAVHGGRVDPSNISLSYFEREQEGGSISTKISTPKMDRSGRIDFWPDGFFDEAEKVLRQLIKPPVR